jgi:membrane-associated protein
MGLIHQFLGIFHSEGIRSLIEAYGLGLVCLIVFAESGAFPMLPGDSLLVICGIYAATPGPGGQAVLSLTALLTLVPLAGVLGGQLGYGVGRWAGPAVHQWKDRQLGPVPVYRRAWLAQTDRFYQRWGGFAVIAGRWVPFVRTGAPLLAGVTRMGLGRYTLYNVLGALSWVGSMVLVGYFLPPLWAQVLPGLRLEDNIEKIVLLVVALSLLPIVYTTWVERRGGAAAGRAKAAPAARRKAPARAKVTGRKKP